MIQMLRHLAVWLCDYYVMTSLFLCAWATASQFSRQPVTRMLLAWMAVTGLAVLAVLTALPAWPRMPLRHSPRPVRTELSSAAFVPQAVTRIVNPVRPDRVDVDPPAASPGRRSLETPGRSAPSVARRAAITGRAGNWPDLEILIAAAYLLGAAMVASWELTGLMSAWRFRAATTLAGESARQELRSLVRRDMGTPMLLESDQISSAVAFGIWRPAIVLPNGAARGERACLRAVLAHEWTHIQRGDLWLAALGRLLLVVQYAQPLFWWLRHRIRLDQELLADACAAQICGSQAYAENLVNWAKRLPRLQPSPAGGVRIWESRQQLMQRIAMLLNEHFVVRTTSSRRTRITAIAAACVAVTTLSLFTLQPGTGMFAAEPILKQVPPAGESSGGDQAAKPAAAQPGVTKVEDAEQSPLLEISGVCHDEQQQPLAKVRLRLIFMNYDDGQQHDLQETRSDAEGRFTFAGVDARKLFATTIQHALQTSTRRLFVVGQSEGKATVQRLISVGDSRSQQVRLAGGEIPENDADQRLEVVTGRVELKLALRPASAVRGRIVDNQGHPVAGVTVSVDQHTYRLLDGVHHAISDGDGRFEINDLAAWDKAAEDKQVQPAGVSRAQIQFETNSRNRGLIRHPDFADKTILLARVPETLEIKLEPPCHLEGQVVIKDTGKPAVDAEIRVVRQAPNDGSHSQATVKTDRDGRYTIDKKMLTGTYRIEASLAGWPGVARNEIELKPGSNRVDLNFQTGGTVQVKLIELGTGQPVNMTPNSCLLIQTLHLATKASEFAAAGEDGVFKISTLPGRTLLMVTSLKLGNDQNVTQDTPRWILDGNQRRAYHIVDVAEGETKPIELRLISAPNLEDEPGYAFGFDSEEQEMREQLRRVIETGTDEPVSRQNVSEVAAVAALKQLGGSIKTEIIDGREYVVSVNMASSEVNGEETENPQVTDESLFYLQKLPRLKSLTLMKGQVTDKGLTYLRGLEHLEFVCLMEAWALTDQGVAQVAALPRLNHFCTHGSEQLTDESLRLLGGAPLLQHVMIYGGRFSDAGLKHLTGLKHLKDLGLTANTKLITDEGLRALAVHSGLENLGLERTQITDAGLKHLHGLKNLRLVEISKSSVTDNGLKSLTQALPNLKPAKASPASPGRMSEHEHD